MKSTLTLIKMKELSLGTKVCEFLLTLKSTDIANCKNFILESTGMSLILSDDTKHSIKDLKMLVEWLDLPSKNKGNLRTNDAEIIIHAKELLKINKKLKETICL